MNGLTPHQYLDGNTMLAAWLARPEGKARAAIVVYPTIANLTPPSGTDRYRVGQGRFRGSGRGFLWAGGS